LGNNDQLFKRRKAEREASAITLRRRPATVDPSEHILIVCEGEFTEKIYLDRVVSDLKLQSVDVKIKGEGAEPLRVVNAAEEYVRKEGRDNPGSYDKVFCVFDRDTHERWEAAHSKILSLNKRQGFPAIQAITNIPCIEYWFILHFNFSRSAYVEKNGKTVGQVAESDLRSIKGFEDYNKKLTEKQLILLAEAQDTAIKSGIKLAKMCEDDGDTNPSTKVHELLQYLIGLRNKELAQRNK
jgi:hypothetical protein